MNTGGVESRERGGNIGVSKNVIITKDNWDRWNGTDDIPPLLKRWTNFTPEELHCSHTEKMEIQITLLDALQELRTTLEEPLKITSGFRDKTHPAEMAKQKPGTGTHCMGMAVDIACSHGKAYRILAEAFEHGFCGIGIKQDGRVPSRFIHLDIAPEGETRPRPHIWTY